MKKMIRKIRVVIGTMVAAGMVIASIEPVMAATDADYIVYYNESSGDGCYHMPDCSKLGKGKIAITLEDAKKGYGLSECSSCNPLSHLSQLAFSASVASETVDTTETIVIEENETKEVTFDWDDDSVTSGSGNKTSSSSSKANSSNNKTSSSSSSGNASSNTSSLSSSGAGNTTHSNVTNSNSGSNSSNTKILMTEKQRKSRFKSKTNPKMGTAVTQLARPASAGFRYADFTSFNSYHSKNGLGGTPIYLLGTIMDMEPVSETGNYYNVAVMVNDCDGYQWYMRVNVAKGNYTLFKTTLYGKAAYIYGTYGGYSGVTNRPMMDATMALVVGGQAINFAIYQ